MRSRVHHNGNHKLIKKLYRFQAMPSPYLMTTGKTEIFKFEYTVIRHTDMGYWIEDHRGKPRWVSAWSRKAYAYENEEDAWMEFVLRLSSRRQIIRESLDFVNDAYNKMTKINNIKQWSSLPLYR